MPRKGRFMSYSSSKPGGGKSPCGMGRRGPAARGSSKGYGRAGSGIGFRRGLAGGLRRACASSRSSWAACAAALGASS